MAKRGPKGLIGNNKPDSAATVEAMLADLPSCDGTATATAGRAAGCPRVKVTTVPEMMALIREGRGG